MLNLYLSFGLIRLSLNDEKEDHMKYRHALGMVAMVVMAGFLVGLAPSDAEAAKKKKMNEGEFKVTSISGALGIGTSPCCGLGIGVGLGVGAAFYHVNDIEIRGDLTYLTWSEGGADFTRLPIIVSGRMYFPQKNDMTFYAQGGLGFSFDGGDYDSKTRLDLVPAGGIQFQINPGTTMGAELAIHVVKESYFTILFKADFAMGK